MSKFTLTIVLDTIDDLAAFVAGIRHSAGQDVLDQVLAQATAPRQKFGEVDENGFLHRKGIAPEKIEPIKRGRKVAKEKPAAPSVEQGSAPAPGSEPEVKVQQAPDNVVYQLTDVREALQRVVSTSGMEVGTGLLQTYAAQRISDLPVEKYAEFVAACRAAEKVAA